MERFTGRRTWRDELHGNTLAEGFCVRSSEVPTGERLALGLGELGGDLLGCFVVSGGGRGVDPGKVALGVELGKGQEKVWQVALDVHGEHGNLRTQGFFDRHDRETGFPAARHANDHAVGHEVVGR